MEIKLKVSEILASNQALNDILAEKLPPALGFRLGLIARQLIPTVEMFNKSRDELLGQYGTLDKEKVGTYTIPPDKVGPFNSSVQAVLDTEVAIQLSAPIPLTSFETAGNLKGNAISQLHWMIQADAV